MNKYKKIDYILNISGLTCPESMMKFRNHFRLLSKGDIMKVLTDDPTTINDIPNFCRFMRHQLIYKKIKRIPYEFIILKN